MICDKCGKKKEVWGKCVCVDCYTTPKKEKKKYITVINELGVTEKVEFGSDRFIIIDYTKNKIASLQQQLANKDKEIERLEEQIENNQKNYVSELAYYTAEENIKEIRQQVCEEIRELLKGKERLMLYCNYYDESYFAKTVQEILDKIEKGE